MTLKLSKPTGAAIKIAKPTGAKLSITPSNLLVDDADALAYLTAVETTDGQALESDVRLAVNAFVKGCKADGIWPALKASCILAGARTRLGALTPLVGAAPTSFNFVDADYNRKTGLVGNGSTKYLDSNRAGNVDPLNSVHLSVSVSSADTGSVGTYIGGGAENNDLTDIARLNDTNQNTLIMRVRRFSGAGAAIIPAPSGSATGFMGCARQTSSSFNQRYSGLNRNVSLTTQGSSSSFNYLVFARNGPILSFYSNARLAFYSIGESINLALLDTRVTTLINAIGAAIP